jgi:hypothetical protein
MIALWKGKNPIYFEVKGQGHHYYKYNFLPFDNLYRRAYFVMHTFLVLYKFNAKKTEGGKISFATHNFSKWRKQLPPAPSPMKWCY